MPGRRRAFTHSGQREALGSWAPPAPPKGGSTEREASPRHGREGAWPAETLPLLLADALGDSPFPVPPAQPLARQSWRAGLHRQQLQPRTYPRSKLPFASLLFTFAVITGWGTSPGGVPKLG